MLLKKTKRNKVISHEHKGLQAQFSRVVFYELRLPNQKPEQQLGLTVRMNYTSLVYIHYLCKTSLYKTYLIDPS